MSLAHNFKLHTAIAEVTATAATIATGIRTIATVTVTIATVSTSAITIATVTVLALLP